MKPRAHTTRPRPVPAPMARTVASSPTRAPTSASSSDVGKLAERPFSLRLPDGDLEDLDRLARYENARAALGHRVNRQTLVRAALRLFLTEKMKAIPADFA